VSRAGWQKPTGSAFQGLLAVVFATSLWMLSRMLDVALASPLFDLAKFVILPLLVGLPLGLS
jgi:hypothetical protein